MPIFWEQVRGWTAIPDTFIRFFADEPGAFWLDRAVNPHSRYSVIGAGRVLGVREYSIADLREMLELFEQVGEQQAPPFDWRPGLVGCINYGSWQGSESTVSADLIWATRAFIFAHATRTMYFIGEFEDEVEFRDWFHAVLLRLALVGGDAAGYQLTRVPAKCQELDAAMKRSDYLGQITRAQNEISRGEVYQLCLTTQLSGKYTGDPLSYYLKLRGRHNAPFAAFIRAQRSYASISPEQLMTVVGTTVTSSPIKGTRPRGNSAEADATISAELASNEKERAENLMIVDLVRNDLAVVCEAASIRVSRLLEVEEHSTVFQLVSQITGELRPGSDALDALASLFPAGSMTGAPKQRAIDLLDEIEPIQRGSYSGAIGYLAASGDLELGMTIRTAVFDGDTVTLGIGGGITIDSQPEAEHDEIVLKAAAHVDMLGATARW